MRVIISGGGTGGHIYPAIAIADEIKRRSEENQVLFVGAQGRMEMEKVPAAGYEIKGLWIQGIHRKRSLKNLVLPAMVIASARRAWRILKQFRPDVVVGVGGYASGPLLWVACRMGIPTLIQEQNSYAGKTNRWLANSVDKICVAYEGMEKFFPASKIVVTGNPVRPQLADSHKYIVEAMGFFERGQNQKTIAIVGGSLGAHSLNQAMIDDFNLIAAREDVLIIWQTGERAYEECIKSKTATLNHVRVLPFIQRMDLVYALADLMITRAGAMTLTELALLAKPTILVPSPYVAENHQMRNAEQLVKEKAALLVENNQTSNKLLPLAFEVIDDDVRLSELSNQIAKFAKANATRSIVDEIEQLKRRNGHVG